MHLKRWATPVYSIIPCQIDCSTFLAFVFCLGWQTWAMVWVWNLIVLYMDFLWFSILFNFSVICLNVPEKLIRILFWKYQTLGTFKLLEVRLLGLYCIYSLNYYSYWREKMGELPQSIHPSPLLPLESAYERQQGGEDGSHESTGLPGAGYLKYQYYWSGHKCKLS